MCSNQDRCYFMAVVVFLMVIAIALLVHFMPSINSNENTNQSTQETKLNTSNILSEKQENMQQMNTSNNIRNVIEEKSKINITNNNKVIIKPQIKKEINFFIDNAHDKTKSELGTEIGRNIKQMHKAMEGHMNKGIDGITRQLLDYSGIIFGIVVAGLLLYLTIRSCKKRESDHDNHQIEMGNMDGFLARATQTEE